MSSQGRDLTRLDAPLLGPAQFQQRAGETDVRVTPFAATVHATVIDSVADN